MLCELCGDREAGFKVVLEGSELMVCEHCKTPEAVKIEQKTPFFRGKQSGESEFLELLPDFGERIREGRKKKQIGRGDLALKLGIKESLFSKIEGGDLEPDDLLVSKIEKELGIKLRGKIDYKLPPKHENKNTTLGDIVELK